MGEKKVVLMAMILFIQDNREDVCGTIRKFKCGTVGQAGGNRYIHNGGGANYLCLPNDPENEEPQSYDNPQLYGAEYKIFADRNPRGMSSILGNREVPCAVCHRKRRSSVITIPGRKTCYKDWNAEYNGYLMANHIGYKRTDYACIDVNAEQFDNKSASDEDGALFYPIRTSCGSLRCPPYKADSDVFCVVMHKLKYRSLE